MNQMIEDGRSCLLHLHCYYYCYYYWTVSAYFMRMVSPSLRDPQYPYFGLITIPCLWRCSIFLWSFSKMLHFFLHIQQVVARLPLAKIGDSKPQKKKTSACVHGQRLFCCAVVEPRVARKNSTSLFAAGDKWDAVPSIASEIKIDR